VGRRGPTKLGQEAAVGITDTDDALAEVRAGRDVVIIFPDRAPGPNRAWYAVRPQLGRDHQGLSHPARRNGWSITCSARVEAKLAEGDAGRCAQSRGEANCRPNRDPRTVKVMEVDWEKAADLWDEVQGF